MAEHPNASVVRRFFEAHRTNDLATLLELLSKDIRWHHPKDGTRLSQHRTVVGIGELAEVNARNFEASEGTFRFDVERVFAGEDYATAITHNTATTAAQSLDLHMAIQFKIENGKIVEVCEAPDDIDAFFDFWRA